MDFKRINNGKNKTRNPDSPLFKRLTRLFSGPIINYRSQNTRQLRRRRLDKYAREFKDVAGQKFERSGYNPLDNFSSYNMDTQSRLSRYADFEQMEFMPELASALDIYADEITTFNSYNKMIRIQCPDEEIKQILETLYYKVLNIEFNLYGWARTMCKYGDFYLYLDIDADMGIKNVIGLPTREIERLEGQDKIILITSNISGIAPVLLLRTGKSPTLESSVMTNLPLWHISFRLFQKNLAPVDAS